MRGLCPIPLNTAGCGQKLETEEKKMSKGEQMRMKRTVYLGDRRLEYSTVISAVDSVTLSKSFHLSGLQFPKQGIQ